MMEEPARLLLKVISVVPAVEGSIPCGSKCLFVRLSRVWMMVLLSSMTDGTLPRVSMVPSSCPLGRVISPLCPRLRSAFKAVSVEVSITVLEADCKTGPTLECPKPPGVLLVVEVAKVTAPGGEEAVVEEAAAVVWTAVAFRGTDAASAMTDFVSADSLASDIT